MHELPTIAAMSKVQAHVRIDLADGRSIGPGKMALLEAIDRTGSLSAAGRSLGMSYRRAWLLLHSVNDSFADAAVSFSVGGKDGGGAALTDFGRELLARYRQFEKGVDELAARSFGSLRTTPASNDPAPARKPLSRPVTADGRKKKSPA